MTALIYVVGIIYLPRGTYLAILAGALAFVLAVEGLRLWRPAVNIRLLRLFGSLVRPGERQHLSGVAWMLAGVALTVAMAEPLPVAVTALLYLVLGDGVASLAGIRLGGPYWPGSTKRVSGSMACFAVCLLIGATILRPDYGWHGVLIGAVAATALELGVMRMNDNFSIPAGAALVLLLSYRIVPFSGLWR